MSYVEKTLGGGSKKTMSKIKNREIRLNMDKEFVDKIEDAFCHAEFEGESILYRTLVSVAREAFIKGILHMSREKKELSKILGKRVYLTEGGVSFIEDILEYYELAKQSEAAGD